ncbi:hypothetical protein N9L47_03455 [Rhodobacteraceae bacterium]|nr:hypothetical protein [Paracoccaceae bacterium]
MIIRGLAILLALGAAAGLWFGYDNLKQLRGTPLFDFRYVVFAVAAFLGLSAIEWALGWIKGKVEGTNDAH